MSESSSSNIRACAACRHQRRRCSPGCILARYFPVERTAQFDAVHRLFGISNLMRFYNAVPREQRDDVIATLTFEAESRRDDPVLGCVAIIHDLNLQIDATRSELDATFSQIAFYRRRQQEQIQMRQLVLAAPQQQQMMMMMPPLAPMLELHADPFPQQQRAPLPPPLLPPVWMNLDEGGVDIGRMKESSGNWHGSRASHEAIRSFNRAPPAPPNPVVDLRSHMPGSSNQSGLHGLRGIQAWSAQDQGIDGPKAATERLFIHNFDRKPPSSA